MKIVKIFGGLGNQMFQYAFGKELEYRCKERVFFDLSEYGFCKHHQGFELAKVFELKLEEAHAATVSKLSTPASSPFNRLRRKYLTKKTHIIDRWFGYNETVFGTTGDTYYDGYWQSEKYFAHVIEAVKKDFTFRGALASKSEEIFRTAHMPLCSIHVRRMDYLEHPNHNVVSLKYYNAAMEKMQREHKIGTFLVFSDDVNWCTNNLQFKGARLEYVDWNSGEESWQDMAMMSLCDHNIIANSSFSWWAAWLNAHPHQVVIAPDVWNLRQLKSSDRYYRFSYDDIVPAQWARLPVR